MVVKVEEEDEEEMDGVVEEDEEEDERERSTGWGDCDRGGSVLAGEKTVAIGEMMFTGGEATWALNNFSLGSIAVITTCVSAVGCLRLIGSELGEEWRS